VAGFKTALIIALVIFVLSYTVKPVLFILTLPINILTLGLFTLILNGLMFYFAANIVEGFSVITFYDAVLGALVVSVIKIIGGYIIDIFLG
jgi:putative membrane protein